MSAGSARRHTGGMKATFLVRSALAVLLVLGAVACGDDSQPDATITPTLELAGKAFTLAQAAGVEVPASSNLELAFGPVQLPIWPGWA